MRTGFLILLAQSLLLISCNNGGLKEDLPISGISEKLQVPSDFLSVNSGARGDFSFPRERKMIVKYLNSGCSVCKLEVREWKKLANIYPYEDHADLLFVVNGVSRKDVEYLFYDADFQVTYYFDSSYSFMDKNEISADRNEQTFIIDSLGNILYQGSPLSGEKELKRFNDLTLIR